MRRLHRVLVAVPLLWACAYAPSALPAVPGKGGPTWIEVTTPHFVMWTDLPRAEAELRLRHLESFRELMIGVVFSGSQNLPARSLVIAQGRWGDWALYGGGDVAGIFQPSERSPFGTPYLAYCAGEMSKSRYVGSGRVVYEIRTAHDPVATLQHELAHLVINAVLPDAPAWLDEGLASYFENSHLDLEEGKAELGGFPEQLGAQINAAGMASVDGVIRAGRAGDHHTHAFYLRSYVLVSFLLNRHPKLFATYQRVLKQVGPKDHGTAWSKIFGQYPTAKMEADMEAWLRGGSLTIYSVNLSRNDLVVERVRALGDAEVYAIRALLHLVLGRTAKKADSLASAEAALALDATQVAAHICKAIAGGEVSPAQARRVAEAHPDDWVAWLLVALTAPNPEVQSEAVHKMCALTERDPKFRPRERMCEAQPRQDFNASNAERAGGHLDEIARVMESDVTRVRNELHRGRQALRAALAEYLAGET